MKKMTKILACLMLFALLMSMVACSSPETIKIGTMADLEGKVIGVQSGTTGDVLATDEIKAKSVERFPQYVDVITALQTKKVDCVIMDVDTANAFLKNSTDLSILDVGFAPEQYAIAVKKGDATTQQAINEVIAEMKADGSLAASFTAHADSNGTAPDFNKGAAGGQLVVGTESGFPPYEYKNGDTIVGVDIDIMAKVAKKLNMELVMEDMAFDGLITALSSGKIKAVAAGMTINEERKVNADFSDPYVDATNIVVIRKASLK